MSKPRNYALYALLATPVLLGSILVYANASRATSNVTIPGAVPVWTGRLPIAGNVTTTTVVPKALLGLPIADADKRVTKKPFKIAISPGHSPVPNDRFTGLHVGVDFETFAEEQDIDVPVFAICNGPLAFKKFATGYGGVAVQHCVLDGKDVTVIYGHLKLASIEVKAGETLKKGDRIGVLGKGGSPETDGVRKHLHLGIHKGTKTDIRGYVQKDAETEQFIDAQKYMGL